MQRYLVVTISRLTGVFRVLFLAAAFWFACPHPGHAMEYYIDTKADMDTIRLVFDQKNLSGSVRRTGRNQVTVSFPDNALRGEKQPTPTQLGGLRIVNSIKMGPSSVTIGTRMNGFGYIRIPAGNGEMLIQFFRDPIGSKWRSPQEKAAEAKEAARKKAVAAKAAAKKSAPAPKKTAPAPKVAAEPKKTPAPPVIAEVDLPADEVSPVLKEELAAADRIEKPVEQAPLPSNRRPFYSVPYTYRAPVAQVGPFDAKAVDTSTPPARAGGASGTVVPAPQASGAVVQVDGPQAGGSVGGQAAGQVSGKIEPPAADTEEFSEDVLPETMTPGAATEETSDQAVSSGGQDAEVVTGEVADVVEQPVPAQTVSRKETGVEPSGQVPVVRTVSDLPPGTVTPPQTADGSAFGRVAAPPPPDHEGVFLPETVEIAEQKTAPPVDSAGAAVEEAVPVPAAAGKVAAPVEAPASQAAGRVEPVEGAVVRQVVAPESGQASGRISPPEESGAAASGAVAPPSLPEGDSFEADQYPPLEAGAPQGEAAAGSEGVAETGDAVQPDGADAYPVESAGQLTEMQKAEAEAAAEGGEGGEGQPSLEDKLKVAKGVLLAAEGALDEGEIEAAVNGFKEVSLMPNIPTEMRLRALYGKAEALTEFHKDDLADNFGEVASAWMEAMNADTKAPNVPMALLNLGLINLKVGNMPEAKAYFNLLKSQYPNDPNVPYISYYWGEYYLGTEEYEKAADQFQYLVQMYPDSKVVRDAAIGLAKALDKLGYNEQAYQIIDYIDKRWPRFYIEDLGFLLMAANTQNRLGKLDDAKGNYWAYYNLSPEAKEADIVLARVGDIYLKEGDRNAAKEIYEKAAKDFPDKEGGLVSMMRLAEEGIYDDPSMSEMDKVFDRPYNLRPQKIYTRIIEKHPDSPLAPLALLKLGMWYYWNKKYGECLGAVQDLLDKYPRSGLREKAGQLGTRVFDKAVPELVKDENYGRVISYWNDYASKNNDGKDINDDTRMGVALSFWKKEQPHKALELIDRYLQDTQVPKYSEMALDMALGIYVDEQAWSKVTELVDLATNKWKLDPRQKVHIEYAQAMAYENLGETERSTPLWAGLASNLLLPESSRAYAMYYMAKSSMKKKELKKVFVYAQEALSMLLETSGDREKIKDCILMTIYAAESSGRYREALKWAAEYDKYIPISDPEWASSRFRLAQLYEKAGATAEWKKLMEEVAKKSPDDLYGRLATSALETYKIEQDASRFKPAPSFQ
ncbi:tetratricopeptide repeat protein [Maridesulfovibrio sp. FT414]|uniref:tetratricopeptide repeat protein n=1 Tax=Maridesulfovibrio sp. FT414 TaxID=2979469 RepID=UPI003D801A33